MGTMKTPHLVTILLASAVLAACAGNSHKPAEFIRVTVDSPAFDPASVDASAPQASLINR
jgi:outer membrane biogenesis lipoprotein LolB